MAVNLNVTGDAVITGDLRLSGGITPAKAKSDVLALAELQAFTVPMRACRHDDCYDMTPGIGISTGTNTICEHSVVKVGGLIKTEILIDLTGLNSGGSAGDIIGKDGGTSECHIGQITAARNGTIIAGRVTCFETPAGGDPDIDIWGSVDEPSGAQDTAITDLSGEEQLINHADWTAEDVDYLGSTTLPDADGYLYLACGAATDGDYTAGILLIELWGTPTSAEHLDIIEGTFGTNAQTLQTPDFGGNKAVANYYARGEIQLPAEYVAGQSIEIRVHAGMLTTVASESCTVDVEVYKSDEDATSTGDLVATADVAQDMNSIVFADLDFTVTPGTLSPGDILDVRLTVAADDDGDAGVMKGCIGSVQLLCDVR